MKKCPNCGLENNYDWPLDIDGEIVEGGCQDCWEKNNDRAWWAMVYAIDDIYESCEQ